MSDDLEKTLLAHLRELGRRKSWRTHDLPEGIAERPAAILRLLDGRRWIEVRLWEWAERHPVPLEDPHDFVIRPDGNSSAECNAKGPENVKIGKFARSAQRCYVKPHAARDGEIS